MDAAARFYERSHRQSLGSVSRPLTGGDVRAASHRYSAAYRYLFDNPGAKVLELGYGGPEVVRVMAETCFKYHIIDVVDRTNGTDLPHNVIPAIGNLDNDWPYQDGSFGVVVGMMILEHLYDPFHSFAEIARVLSPWGRAFINLPNIAALKNRLQLLRGNMPVTSSKDWFDKREWDGNHLHSFTVADVRRIAELHGMQVAEIHPVGNHTLVKKLRPSLLCHEITYVLTKR